MLGFLAVWKGIVLQTKTLKLFSKRMKGGGQAPPFILFGSPHSPDKSSSAAWLNRTRSRVILAEVTELSTRRTEVESA